MTTRLGSILALERATLPPLEGDSSPGARTLLDS